MLPLLSKLSHSYLGIQASSTPCERPFSTAGDTISQERSNLIPDQLDMQICLQKKMLNLKQSTINMCNTKILLLMCSCTSFTLQLH